VALTDRDGRLRIKMAWTTGIDVAMGATFMDLTSLFGS
jgi:hypothetical protein